MPMPFSPPPGAVREPAPHPGNRPAPRPAHGRLPCGHWARRAAPLCLAALCLCLAAGCAAAPLVITGAITGGSIVGAEVEDSQQKGTRNDTWDYADEYFARGRNRTAGNAGGNGTVRTGAAQPAFANQPDQDANRTRSSQRPPEAVSIPMPGDRSTAPEKSRKPAP